MRSLYPEMTVIRLDLKRYRLACTDKDHIWNYFSVISLLVSPETLNVTRLTISKKPDCKLFIPPTYKVLGGRGCTVCRLSVCNIFVSAQYLGKTLMDFDQILHIN